MMLLFPLVPLRDSQIFVDLAGYLTSQCHRAHVIGNSQAGDPPSTALLFHLFHLFSWCSLGRPMNAP